MIVFNPYWSRAWITQEILLARRISVHLDNESIGFEEMIKCIELIPFSNYHKKAILKSDFVQIARRWRKKAGPDNLIALLADFHSKDCQDKRDNIFSLRSLCSDSPQVNYRISADELATQVLCQSLDKICICSAAVVARALGFASQISPPSKKPNLQSPYLEFDAKIDKVIPGSEQRHLYNGCIIDTSRYDPAGHYLDFSSTCESVSFERVEVWWMTRSREPFLQSLVCNHPTGLSQQIGYDCQQMESVDKMNGTSKVRISLKVLAELWPNSIKLCRHALSGRTREPGSLIGYPMIRGPGNMATYLGTLPPIRNADSSRDASPAKLRTARLRRTAFIAYLNLAKEMQEASMDSGLHNESLQYMTSTHYTKDTELHDNWLLEDFTEGGIAGTNDSDAASDSHTGICNEIRHVPVPMNFPASPEECTPIPRKRKAGALSHGPTEKMRRIS
ncbi:hypothetical protein NX059_010529 [Plenodomus lindquistii]|nr:hypothetical protein NX059_010529 [Plenodomus lindquistii]